MNEITIRVVGIPAPQGSKTLTRWGAMIEASKKVKPWRTDVKEAALKCYNSGALNLPVKAEIEFIFCLIFNFFKKIFIKTFTSKIF